MSSLRDRDEPESHYEERVRTPLRVRGVIPPAGVYLHAGRYELATHHSDAERRLRDAGALYVATVTFDGRPIAALTGGGPRVGTVVPVDARAAARETEPARN
jgi:hypothetical protein